MRRALRSSAPRPVGGEALFGKEMPCERRSLTRGTEESFNENSTHIFADASSLPFMQLLKGCVEAAMFVAPTGTADWLHTRGQLILWL
ncbi:hypothetical protein CB1_000589015 [Camelus ferus]|nr:hypothetical protein CB1_000589015 [Camelus ferus]